MKSMEIKGFFLDFPDEDKAAIDLMLTDEGYEPDGEGLKKFLLDCAHESSEEIEEKGRKEKSVRISEALMNFVREDPESAKRLAMAGVSTIKGIITKAAKKAGK